MIGMLMDINIDGTNIFHLIQLSKSQDENSSP